MIMKNINNIVSSIFAPSIGEAQKAQQESIERIRSALIKAESEVTNELSSMTTEQRLKAAEQQFEKAQEQMLTVVTSLFKSLLYLSPPVGMLVDKSVSGARHTVESLGGYVSSRAMGANRVEKEVCGEVVE